MIMMSGKPPLSRVHELARMSRIDLMGLYLSMLDGRSQQGGSAATAAAGWDRDRLITAIRNLEDPR
jgi:hypothetical protein